MFSGRRIPTGGQIFPQPPARGNQNQNFQPPVLSNMQQQIQMVQMQYHHNMPNQASKMSQSPKTPLPADKPKGTLTQDQAKSEQNDNIQKGNQRSPVKNQDLKPSQNQRDNKTQQNNQPKTPTNPQGSGGKQDNQNANKGIKPEKFDKNPMNMRFGNTPQQDSSKLSQQPPNQQQGSLMGQPPALMMNPPNIKLEMKNSPNHGRSMNDFNSGNQPNISFNGQDHSRQNSSRGGRGGKPSQRGSPGNQNATPQSSYSYEQDKSGRNARSSDKGRRSGGAPPSHAVAQRGSGKGFYYGGGVKEKMSQMFTEPQVDLPPLDMNEKKFNNHAKLFIGNIPKNCEQKEIVDLFEKYGEVGSVYLNKDSAFAFINFDYKANATKALRELDNTLIKNRHLKVRFATISEGIKVKNLSPYVSNELLEKVFSIFGMIEYCRVSVDERGMSKGEGAIIFRDKKAAVMATKKCQEECLFLSGALRPVVVSTLEPSDDQTEGLPESSLPKNDEYRAEREILPHFADANSFEHEFGLQWKQLFNMYEEKKAVLDRDFQIELERLEKKMVLAKVEYETDKLRKELAQREAESAELRRHFEFSGGNNYNGSNYNSSPIGPSSGAGSASYDPYPGSKRPLDQGYDGSFSGPYDPTYGDNYDRASAYPPSDYDRNYDQGYGNYGREDYRREGAYGPDDPFERAPYDHTSDISSERPPIFDNSTESYTKSQESPIAGEPFKAPSKRPRY